jgi:hypothetical protein
LAGDREFRAEISSMADILALGRAAGAGGGKITEAMASLTSL